MIVTDKFTTREIARDLNCLPSEVVKLLNAAGIIPIQCGSAYLWDADHVNRVLKALKDCRSERKK